MKYVDVKNQRIDSLPKKHKKPLWKFLLPAFIVLLVGFVAIMYFSRGSKAIFDPISIIANVSASDLKETDGRTNVLIMGLDKRDTGNVTSVLTDTLMVASIGRIEGDIVLISLPRDLWVQNPNGGFSKINAVYGYANRDPQATQKVVENVLGLPIHYYVVVDFDIFKETIDTLGGVDINVENAFTDYEYPVEGKEADMCGIPQEEANKRIDEGQAYYQIFPCRYETLKFQTGIQKMDGVTALKYVRSRHAIETTEYTDFARAKRQQNVITAVKNKALSMNTILNPIKLKDLYDTYSKNIQTNMDLTTIQSFYLLSQQVSFNNTKSIVLDDRSSAEVGGLLYAPTDMSLYGGYVLIPRAGDFSQLHAYVQRYIFGTK